MNERDRDFLLLLEKDEPSQSTEYISQIKEDGRRVKVKKEGDTITFIGRDNINPSHYPEVLDNLKKIPFDFEVDTEFAVYDKEGIKSDRGLLQTRDRTAQPLKIRLMSQMMPVTPTMFDILSFKGQSILNEPYEERKRILDEAFSSMSGVKVVHDFGSADEAWKYAEDHHLEGIVQRKKSAPYLKGRSDIAIKVKRKITTELLVTSYIQHPAGIRVQSSNGIAITINGAQHKSVKEKMDKFGCCRILIRSMADRTGNNKFREPVYAGEVRDNGATSKEN